MSGFGEATIDETWKALNALLVKRTEPVNCLYVVRELERGDLSVVVHAFRVSCEDVNHEDTIDYYAGRAPSERLHLIRHQVGLRLDHLAREFSVRRILYANGLEVGGGVITDPSELVDSALIARFVDPSLDKALVCRPYKE